MGLNADDSRAPYAQIAEQLRHDIESGTYAPGEKLPTGRELVGRWAVSTNTVQRALDLLRTEGLIFGIQGKGNFVRSDIEAPADGEPDLHIQVAELTGELEAVKKRLSRLERKTKGSN